MESIVVTQSGNYGFGHDWFLIVTLKEKTKSFFLGQDVKFCRRVLGMEPIEVVRVIGSNDLCQPETLRSLGEFIVEHLDLDEEKIENLEQWELCCQ